MDVKIATSTGRSGFGPKLALSYNSGTGNGPFGMGWGLGTPSITRKTDKGLPRYRDDEDSDVFILSEAEDLVPMLERDASGHWRIVEEECAGYCVRRYRPRVEGLFARIERWVRLRDGDTHWRSISPDNVLTVYGETPASRIADPTAPARVFSWLICRSHDDRGDAILYDYAAENGTGVASAANERYRTNTANRYLKRVRYGNRRPVLVDSSVEGFRPCHLSFREEDAHGLMFSLVFDYGEGHYEEAVLTLRARCIAGPAICPIPT